MTLPIPELSRRTLRDRGLVPERSRYRDQQAKFLELRAATSLARLKTPFQNDRRATRFRCKLKVGCPSSLADKPTESGLSTRARGADTGAGSCLSDRASSPTSCHVNQAAANAIATPTSMVSISAIAKGRRRERASPVKDQVSQIAPRTEPLEAGNPSR